MPDVALLPRPLPPVQPPTLTLTLSVLPDFATARAAYQAEFAPYFQRRDQAAWAAV